MRLGYGLRDGAHFQIGWIFGKVPKKGGVETIAIRTCDYKNQIAGRNHRIVAQWWTLCEPVTICKTERNWSEAQNLLGSKSNKWYILNGSNFDKVDYAQLCKTQIENIKLKSMYNCVRFSFKGVRLRKVWTKLNKLIIWQEPWVPYF